MLKSLWYWRLAVLRCFIYGCYVSWGMFVAGVEGFERWSDMTEMQQWKLLGNMAFVGFGGVILSFMDSTIQRLTADKTEQPKEPNP